jgi:tagatose-1,6-bisphosphate aldolase non-catalytic subunit AgaZ/GatZ
VGKVGTDLHTSDFDPVAAARLYCLVAPLGSLVKGHYTDWVANPEAYPAAGMGGANVGPEFTAAEYLALADLSAKEADLYRARPGVEPSNFMAVLEQAVVDSGRWQKWLLPEERGEGFADLSPERRAWLVQTGSRYIWTQPSVTEARAALYHNLSVVYSDPHQAVVDRIAQVMEKYVVAFHLFDSLTLFEGDE